MVLPLTLELRQRAEVVPVSSALEDRFVSVKRSLLLLLADFSLLLSGLLVPEVVVEHPAWSIYQLFVFVQFLLAHFCLRRTFPNDAIFLVNGQPARELGDYQAIRLVLWTLWQRHVVRF